MDAKTAWHRPEDLTELYVKHFSSTAGICRNTVISQKLGDWSTEVHLRQNVRALSWTVLVFLPPEITVIIAYYFYIIKDCNSAICFQT